MKTSIIIILAILIIGGVIFFTGNKAEKSSSLKPVSSLTNARAKKAPSTYQIRKESAMPEDVTTHPAPRSNYSRLLSEMGDNLKVKGYRIVRADEDGMTIELAIPEYQLKSPPEDEGSRQLAAIPGYFSLGEPGHPALPAKVITLPLPGVKDLSLTIESSGIEESGGIILASSPDDDWIRRKIRRDQMEELMKNPPFSPASPGDRQAKMNTSLEMLSAEEKPPEDDVLSFNAGGDGSLYPSEIAEANTYWKGGEQFVALRISPLQYSVSKRKIISRERVTVDIRFGAKTTILPKADLPDFGEQFALANSDSFKAFVYQDGIHTITYQNLVDAGFNIGQDPRALRMYFMGQEISIYIEGEDDGSWDPGDYIDFYGEKNTGFYSQTNAYWLYQTAGSGTRMVEVSSPRCGRPGRELHFLDSLHREENIYYKPYLPVAENKSCWFWGWAGYAYGWPAPFNTEFVLSGVSSWEGTVSFTGHYFGYTDYEAHNPDHHTRVYLNGLLIGDWTWDGQVAYTFQTDIPQSAFNEGTNTITTEEVDDLGLDMDYILADSFGMTYYRDYKSVDDRLSFTASRKGDYRVNGFAGEDLALYDITDSAQPRRLTDFNVWTDSGNYLIFRKSESGEREYAALNRTAALAPRLEQNTASDIPSPRVVDYIIITHPDFTGAIQPLASFREETAHGGFRVGTFEVQDIYNTFSFGNFSPYAIKRFLEYAYTDWDTQTHPQYALLVGDGNYDYQDYQGLGVPNYLPPYMFRGEYMETCSDNWYACFIGEDKVPDMDLGRICVTSAAETSDQVAKIIGYENGTDGLPWQKDILMVAGNVDPDAGDFPADSDWLIANYINPSFTADTAYADDLGVTGTGAAIINGFNTGRVLINYLGHGTINTWANKSAQTYFSSATLTSLTNADRLPIMITPTCLNGNWSDVANECLAEAMTLAVGKGTIANVSPSGLSLNTPAKQMTGYIFTELLSNGYPFGTALTRAKAQLAGVTTYLYLLDIYTLFGDPAQPMK